MNGVKSFTIYREYIDLITLLPDKRDQADLILALCNYMFFDEEPKLKEYQTKIYNNLKRPLDKSKNKSLNRGSNNIQNEIKTKSNSNQNEIKSETHHDVYVNVHDNVNVDILENRGNGGKKPFKQIIDYLNTKTGSNYKYNAKSTQTKIDARLNEGYSLDDFIVVIDKKCEEWLGTEFEKYLCPETLFGTKFEKYLNQNINISNKTLKNISMSEIDKAIELERMRLNK